MVRDGLEPASVFAAVLRPVVFDYDERAELVANRVGVRLRSETESAPPFSVARHVCGPRVGRIPSVAQVVRAGRRGGERDGPHRGGIGVGGPGVTARIRRLSLFINPAGTPKVGDAHLRERDLPRPRAPVHGGIVAELREPARGVALAVHRCFVAREDLRRLEPVRRAGTRVEALIFVRGHGTSRVSALLGSIPRPLRFDRGHTGVDR